MTGRDVKKGWTAIGRRWPAPIPGLVALSAVVALLTLVFVTLDLWGEHRRVLVDAEAGAGSNARILAEHAGRTFGTVATVVTAIAQDVDRTPLRRRAEQGDPLSRVTPALRAALSLYVADGRGRVLVSYDPSRAVGSLMPAEIPRTGQAPGEVGVTISVPFKRDEAWVIAVTRRVEEVAGRPATIVVGEVLVDYLLQYYGTTAGDAARTQALFRSDGVLLARMPFAPNAQGRSFASSVWFKGMLPSNEDGVFRSHSAIDGKDRIGSWRRVTGLPLVAVATVERWAALAPWRQVLIYRLASTLCLVAVMVLMTALLVRQVRRSQWDDARLRAAVDASMDAFFMLRTERDRFGEIVDFRFVDTNPNGELALGLSRAQIVGERLSALSPRGHFESTRMKYASVVESGEPLEEELVVDGASGPEWMQHQIVRLEDGVAITSRNVTERRRAEENLIAAEMRVAEIAASIPGAVVQYRREADGSYRFTYASPSIERLVGLSAQELEADPLALLQIALPEDRGKFQRAVVLSARRLTPLRVDYRSNSPAGVRWLRIDALPKRRSNGAVAWSGLLTDVTAEKHAEAELELAKRDAEDANQTKSAFLANMSHELRTPLNAIIGFSEGLGVGVFGPLSAKQREYVEDIRSAGTHLLQIINDLLDLSKIEAGKAKLHEEPVVLSQVIDSAMTLVRGHARDKGLALDAVVDPALPAVMADEVKLKQILVNLLSNAVKFTAKGSVSLVARHREDGVIALVVRDTGYGIASDEIDKVMEPFWQAEGSHVRRVGGTGLGLPLVKHLIAMHGGTMSIESTVGVGTTVTVTMPAERVIPASEPQDPVQPEPRRAVGAV